MLTKSHDDLVLLGPGLPLLELLHEVRHPLLLENLAVGLAELAPNPGGVGGGPEKRL